MGKDELACHGGLRGARPKDRRMAGALSTERVLRVSWPHDVGKSYTRFRYNRSTRIFASPGSRIHASNCRQPRQSQTVATPLRRNSHLLNTHPHQYKGCELCRSPAGFSAVVRIGRAEGTARLSEGLGTRERHFFRFAREHRPTHWALKSAPCARLAIGRRNRPSLRSPFARPPSRPIRARRSCM